MSKNMLDSEIVVKLLRDANEDIPGEAASDLNYERLAEGKGFTSHLYTVRYQGKKYAVKITSSTTLVEGQEAYNEIAEQQHNRELVAYQWFKQVIEDYGSQDLSRIVRFYAGTPCLNGEKGYIIMDELSDEVTYDVKFTDGYKLSTIYSIVDQMIGYHTAYLSSEIELTLPSKDLLFKLGSNFVQDCVGKLPEKTWITDDVKKTIKEWSTPEALERMQYELVGDEKDIPLVLCHGDLWQNNILLKRDENGDVELLSIVDWQCATVGLPMLDMTSVLIINLDTAVRRAHEDEILQYYVDQIDMNRSRFVKKYPITFDKIRSMYRRTMRFAALQLMFVMAFQSGEDVNENEEGDGVIARRLRGALEDCFEYEKED